MLAQLRAKGADAAKETQDMEGVGRFGWVTDPEGNRVELWSPPDRVTGDALMMIKLVILLATVLTDVRVC